MRYLSAFNTPLEMRPLRVFWRRMICAKLSILHWRCLHKQGPVSVYRTAEPFNTPLEMQNRLATSDGASPRPFNTPLEMPCGFEAHRDDVPMFSFNTPLEMHVGVPPHRQGNVVCLSILHWRCSALTPCGGYWDRLWLSILHWRCWGFLCLVFVGF